MPPVQTQDLPHSLIERFKDGAADCMLHILAFLSPLSLPR
jgi:hypothetical protein